MSIFSYPCPNITREWAVIPKWAFTPTLSQYHTRVGSYSQMGFYSYPVLFHSVRLCVSIRNKIDNQEIVLSLAILHRKIAKQIDWTSFVHALRMNKYLIENESFLNEQLWSNLWCYFMTVFCYPVRACTLWYLHCTVNYLFSLTLHGADFGSWYAHYHSSFLLIITTIILRVKSFTDKGSFRIINV